MRWVVVAATVLLVGLAVGGWWLTSRPGPPTENIARMADAGRVGEATAGTPPAPVSPAETPGTAGAVNTLPGPMAAEDSLPPAGLDLEQLRSKLPDHSYWKLLAPTEDKALLAQREQRARELNVLYGKVLSGTGSDAEIVEYFAERRRISEDAISFASGALEELAGTLDEREQAMFELAIKLHRARLDELPRRIQEAETRKREQDRRREEWLRTGK